MMHLLDVEIWLPWTRQVTSTVTFHVQLLPNLRSCQILASFLFTLAGTLARRSETKIEPDRRLIVARYVLEKVTKFGSVCSNIKKDIKVQSRRFAANKNRVSLIY